VEICLWGFYWWRSCNDGITFRLSKKVQELALKAKGKHLCPSQMCDCWENFTYSSEKCVGFHDANFNYIKSGSPKTCLF